DRDVGDVTRNLDPGTDLEAIGGDEHTLIRDLEAAVARVGLLTARHLDGEQTFAVDGDVERAPGLLERTLSVQPLHRGEMRSAADLNRRRGVRLGAAEDLRTLHGLVEQVLELRSAALEARGVHVREVVRDDFGAGLLRGHSGRGGSESGIHWLAV